MIKGVLFIGFATLLATLSSANGVMGSDSVVDGDTAVLGDSLEAVRDNVLVARFANLVMREPAQLRVEQIKIKSVNDPNYAGGVSPKSFSFWTVPTRYTLRKSLNVKTTRIFMFLEKSLRPDCEYTVEITNGSFLRIDISTGHPQQNEEGQFVNAPPPELKLVWRGDRRMRSNAISVNHAGYLPDAAKFAYLTQYAGAPNGYGKNFTEVDFSDIDVFSVLDAATGSEVYSGKPRLCAPKAADDEGRDWLSGSRVWELDFSGLTKPGGYRVHVPRVGVSHSFTIASGVYNQVFGVLARGLYHQRCGTELTAEFTRHPHPVCHASDARIPHIREYEKPDVDFYPQTPGGISCPRGHHDAGDYGKYVQNGSLFAFYILLPFEVAPAKLAYKNSPVANIPEASANVPTLIQTAKWELDWISNMQDKDGGVFSIVKPHAKMSYQDSLAGEEKGKFKEQRVVWWKDTQVTASFAAVLARAARTEAFISHFPNVKDEYVSKAEKAWIWCMKHVDDSGVPRKPQGHHYGTFLGSLDEYAWMAAELWLTTGKPEYHAYFLKHHKPEDGWQWSWWPLYQASGAATKAYAFGKRQGIDAEMLEKCRAAIIRAAEDVTRWQDDYAHRSSLSADARRHNRWGWYFLFSIASYNQLLAAELVKDADKARMYRQGALFNADQELGNNPANISYLTGFGRKRPVDIVHQSARFDGIVEPIPGIPLGFHPVGFNRGTSDRALMASFSAGGFPVAYRYVDCWNIEQEFTIPELGKMAVVYGLLGEPAAQRPGKPELSVSANGLATTVAGAAPFKVRFEAKAKGANGKAIREHYWDLDNEEFSCDSSFEYVFNEPGLKYITCTVTDEDGWISYGSILVQVSQPVAELPNKGLPFAPSAKPGEEVYIWRFDGSTSELKNRLELSLTGNAAFSEDNLLWMRERKGQAVRFSSADDGVAVKFGDKLFSDPAIRAVRVDAMVSYDAEIPRGNGHSKILMLEAGWDNRFGIYKDTWAGKQVFSGKSGLDQAAKQNIISSFNPLPGWRIISMGFDKDSGKAFFASGEQKTEFEYKPGTADTGPILSAGGFKGFLDELKVTVRRAADKE